MYLYKSTLNSIDKTKAIADSLYKLSRKGDVFALYGDIGVGKTTFVRYFISNATKTNYVPSPSYNIYFKYDSKKAEIYHMDAWRISNDLEVFNLGVLDFFQDSIFLIEWANKIDAHLPVNKLSITLEYSKTFRTISFHGDENWKKRLEKDFKRKILEK
ncbi:MAG: tRNA (adenosine(37)-N6)-threonylcarbamoyltransferase complex ATPase subunit type 1 TsaE [Gammaproteobacteria bacterium]|nr:tRNA (adenosine(37)-N6)-threonylcarbamoyltransferase complex ATPase subunit type 1 TsaE [Gammaproteobacteria bacterium]